MSLSIAHLSSLEGPALQLICYTARQTQVAGAGTPVMSHSVGGLPTKSPSVVVQLRGLDGADNQHRQ